MAKIKELSYTQLKKTCDPAIFKFKTTKELEPFTGTIGQARGIKAIETVEECEKVKECYHLAYKNFNDVLSKIGLEVIKAEGEEFDPNLHEAVMQTPTEETPENVIISELQKGYKLGDKVLRASLVNVATAP